MEEMKDTAATHQGAIKRLHSSGVVTSSIFVYDLFEMQNNILGLSKLAR